MTHSGALVMADGSFELEVLIPLLLDDPLWEKIRKFRSL